MKHWPSAFGHESFAFSLRVIGIALVVATAGCAGSAPDEAQRRSSAEPSLEQPQNKVEAPQAEWPGRGIHQNEFAETLAATAAPAYDSESMAATKASYSGMRPKIVTPRKPLQCVPYARMISGIELRGDANTWWESAAGKFRRGREPEPGAVLVFKGSDKNPRGHVGVVNRILNEREILLDHANWLNNRKIHLATPVIDVSPENDWSAIRVWYSPGSQFGANVYPTEGFIYSDDPSIYVTVSDTNIRERPTTKSGKIGMIPRQSRVEVVGKVPGAPWYRIVYNGSGIGFVYAKLVHPKG
jgi:surface antigen